MKELTTIAIGCRLTPKPRPRQDATALIYLSLLLPGAKPT